MNENPALRADTPSRSAGGAAGSACPTRSLSGDKHLPTPPSPPSPPPPPHRRPGLRGCPGLAARSAGAAAAPRPGRSGSCRRTCPPGRGEARQTMGLRGRGAARGMAELGATGWRGSSSGVTPGSPGFRRWTMGHPAARRAPSSASTNTLPGRREGRRGFARKPQCLPPGDDTEARFGSLTGPVPLDCAIFRFCPWPFKPLSAPPGTL